MAKWRLAKGLRKLREQVNALAPNRSKASDGSIADSAHASRKSDHNPWVKDSAGVGVVTAIDITHDPINGLDGSILSSRLADDARTKYVIFNRQIWKARTGKWEPYRGPNPHDHHVHISIKPEYMDDTSPWLPFQSAVPIDPLPPVSLALIKRGSTGTLVKVLQNALGIEADGHFGYGTERAVKRFQREHGLREDGIVGPDTWTALGNP